MTLVSLLTQGMDDPETSANIMIRLLPLTAPLSFLIVVVVATYRYLSRVVHGLDLLATVSILIARFTDHFAA